MKRTKKMAKFEDEMKKFLKKNPGVKEAMRIFDISYDQYQKALRDNYCFYTDTSTSPKRVKCNNY